MKKVYQSIEQVAHIWANNPELNIKCKNAFVENKAIYSYGYHYPMAVLLGDEIAVLNDVASTHTTNRHRSVVFGAVSHKQRFLVNNTELLKQIIVTQAQHNCDYFKQNKETLKTFLENYIKSQLVNAANNAAKRKKPDLIRRELSVGIRYYNDACAIAAFFNIKISTKIHNQAKRLQENSTEVIAIHKKELEAEAKKRAKIQAERDKEKMQVALSVLPSWLEGAELDYKERDAIFSAPSQFLRIKGEEIETSRGATFPIEHAKKAFSFVVACRNSGKTWHKNGQQIRVGHFNLNSIDKHGNVVAGCHKVAFEAIEPIAKKLGLM